MRRFIGALALGAVAVFGFGAQKAEAIIYPMVNDNLGLTGPFGQVEVVLLADKSKAKITATPFDPYLLVDGGSVALSTGNTASYVVGSFSATGALLNTGLTTPTLASVGSGNNDGFGNYDIRVNLSGGSGDAASMVMFTIMNVSGTWSDESQVLVDNNEGFQASIHYGLFTLTDNSAGETVYTATGTTGFATTPIPGAVWLFGTGLLGLLGIGYSRRRQAAA